MNQPPALSKTIPAPKGSHLDTLLPLIHVDENPYNIFSCDWDKTLIQIIKETHIMNSLPPKLDCQVSIVTLDTYPDKVILNHDQIHTTPLRKIHHYIRPLDGIKIYIQYENRYLYLIPNQYPRKKDNEAKNKTQSILRQTAELIQTSHDPKALKIASSFISAIEFRATELPIRENSRFGVYDYRQGRDECMSFI